MLEYYADNEYKKFKGRIDLDECEQVLYPIRRRHSIERARDRVEHRYLSLRLC